MGQIFVVWYVMSLYSHNGTLWVRFNGWYCNQPFIDWTIIWVVYRTDPLGSRNGPSAIGPQLFGSSAVIWYVMSLYSLNGTLWVRFDGWYWTQSSIDGSNIWVVDKTSPLGPDMDHPPLGRGYLDPGSPRTIVYFKLFSERQPIDEIGWVTPYINPHQSIPIMSELLHVLEPSFERGPGVSRQLHHLLCAECAKPINIICILWMQYCYWYLTWC